MRARLGDVLYLAGCVLSLLWLTLAVVGGELIINDWDLNTYIVFNIFLIAPAALFWSIGAACLYVLRGDTEIGIFPAIAPRRVVKFVGQVSVGMIFVLLWSALSSDKAFIHSAIEFFGPALHVIAVILVFSVRLIGFLVSSSITVGLMYAVLALPWREMNWGERIVMVLVLALGLALTSSLTAAVINPDPHGDINGWIQLGVLACGVPLAWLLRSRFGMLNVDAAVERQNRETENS